ncbi:MAG: CDP-glycerol glycerophosphotransferase family protein [Blautia sp.]|nr:CDP-glycerol glycerophosphotransferase family protein [Blautia sp.]
MNIKTVIMRSAYYFFGLFPINNRKIVISSYAGRGYGNEGASILEALDKIEKNYEAVWIVKNMDEKMPEGIRKVKYLSLRSIYDQCTARIWIDNRRKPSYVHKRKKQYYIQTWHGNVCIKWVEKDAAEMMEKQYVENAKHDAQMTNLMISGSKWRTQNYRKAFWYDGEIYEGNLYKSYKTEENKQQARKDVQAYFGFKEEKRTVLYAPTFRNDGNLECYDIDYSRMLKAFEERFGGKWRVIVRLHPNIADKNTKISYSEDVVNGSMYPGIDDIICFSDCLITDFSGCMFTAYRQEKKVLIYASDMQDYLAKERGVYFEIQKMPAPLATDNDELEQTILGFDEEKYEIDRKALVDTLGYCENDANAEIAKRIKILINRK